MTGILIRQPVNHRDITAYPKSVITINLQYMK